jgi:hypothetical protein
MKLHHFYSKYFAMEYYFKGSFGLQHKTIENGFLFLISFPFFTVSIEIDYKGV